MILFTLTILASLSPKGKTYSGSRTLPVGTLLTPTESLIRSGAAIPFTAYASSPTVTMPRLKAITTGSVPSFLDVILNIAESDTSSTLAFQDTWLAQLKARGDQLVMYGDDTWLKLFPGMFGRADGTTSFFVSVSGLVIAPIATLKHPTDPLYTGLHGSRQQRDPACP